MEHILNKIKEFNTIIIHTHTRPDGDAIGSQYGLMYLIKSSFPNKNIYISGESSNYFSFIGNPSLVDESLFNDALSICLDCGNKERLSDDRYYKAKYSIKIDHHFDSDKYTDYEYVDYNASSTTQIITEFYKKFEDELIMSTSCAEALFTGLLTDTGRFQNSNVNSKTFLIASELLSYGVNIMHINNSLNLESESTLRLKGYCLNNFKITKHGFAYIILKRDIIEKFNVSDESASSVVSTISTIKDCPVWALILETEKNIRIRLRSRGPEVNILAQKFNGGGHKMASGGTLEDFNELEDFIFLADDLVKNFKKL